MLPLRFDALISATNNPGPPTQLSIQKLTEGWFNYPAGVILIKLLPPGLIRASFNSDILNTDGSRVHPNRVPVPSSTLTQATRTSTNCGLLRLNEFLNNYLAATRSYRTRRVPSLGTFEVHSHLPEAWTPSGDLTRRRRGSVSSAVATIRSPTRRSPPPDFRPSLKARLSARSGSARLFRCTPRSTYLELRADRREIVPASTYMSTASVPAQTGFVKTPGTKSTLNGAPYTLFGCLISILHLGSTADIDKAFVDIVASGATTVRTRGFNEVTSANGLYFHLWNGKTATVNTGAGLGTLAKRRSCRAVQQRERDVPWELVTTGGSDLKFGTTIAISTSPISLFHADLFPTPEVARNHLTSASHERRSYSP
ncbi:hypothetical protein B0H14DRAFT_2608221 [Mycena olivaceomarginata]|nr:hypothetical protein B0H14DRAFT_2608221 [Mycena olivaceomarginata]